MLLDTSFLITLVDPSRPHHEVAKRYYRECIRRRVVMFLSTIVIAEFHVKQPITDLALRNFLPLPFNIDDAMACGELFRRIGRDEGDDRVRFKDDLKIIAQAIVSRASYVLCEDESSMAKYLRRAREHDSSAPKVVLLKDGYTEALFNEGQEGLGFGD